MWISQTYLGYHEDPNAKAYIYFLFEDYGGFRTDFADMIKSNLEKLGERSSSAAQIFVPNPRSEEKIRKEVQEKFNE